MPDNENTTETNETATNELVLRYQFESYMMCGSGNSAAYQLIGEGFTSFPEAKNPKEYTRKYINYKTEKSDVIGYAPSISYSCDVITGDPVVQEIVEITDAELVGTDTHRDIVNVNCWDEVSTGEYRAFKRTFAVIPANKGDGTDALIYTGTLKAVSDMVPGTFNRTTKAFTPDVT
ncbi:MAG: hypothetical protein II897_03945 [Clostridia bacterium]|nr:hypothetical protein [Clostridia bacterium]